MRYIRSHAVRRAFLIVDGIDKSLNNSSSERGRCGSTIMNYDERSTEMFLVKWLISISIKLVCIITSLRSMGKFTYKNECHVWNRIPKFMELFKASRDSLYVMYI